MVNDEMVNGFYVHIPFCKSRCLYCDFFSTTMLERRKEYINALLMEIEERKNEAGEPIQTIYIGGGTPSTLEAEDVHRIIQAINTDDAQEITMELNPGDASPEYLQALRHAGINRLSIGVQAFQDDLLCLIGRRHSAEQAKQTILWAQKAGFDNLSIDLIYALPTQTMDKWQQDIQTALSLNVQHISTYGLMYEEGTPLTRMRDNNQLTPVDEETEIQMYDTLCQQLKQAGFVHYEVSNFALPGYEAKHNSNYWNHTPYIGIGASAHSLINNVRSWNPSNLDTYINGIVAHNLQRESETLSQRDLFNEKIMLGLRTNQGISEKILDNSRDKVLTLSRHSTDIVLTLSRLTADRLLKKTPDGRFVATQKGLHVLNRIIEELMIDE